MKNGWARAADFEYENDSVNEAGSRIAVTFPWSKKKPTILAQFSAVTFVALLLLIVCPLFGQMMGPGAPGAMRYVSAQGSDSKNGLSWSTAKSTISAAIRSCPNAGSCTINVSSVRLSFPLSVNRADTRIQCASGATISTAVEREAPITVRADNVDIRGCTFDYSSGVGSTVIAIPRSISHVTIANNIFRNYLGRHSWVGVIHVGNRSNNTATTAVTDVRITGNQFLNVDPDAINLQDDVFRATISNNVVMTDVSKSSSPTINAQTSDPGSMLDSISVLGNSISKGTHNNCIQIQNLRPRKSVIQNVTVSRNTCSLQLHAGAGTGATGFSMAGINGLREANNIFEGHGQAISGNAPFEIVTCTRAVSFHNVATLGNVTTAVMNAFTVIGHRDTVTRDVDLVGDSVNMAMHPPAEGSCYHIYAGPETRIEGVTMTGNSCNLEGSTTNKVVRGIWIQSNGSGAVIRGGRISGNVITGATRTEAVGIHFEQDAAGAISGWQTKQNQFRNIKRDIIGRQAGQR